jgi:hypothetical protein
MQNVAYPGITKNGLSVNINDAIFELLEATYGLNVDAIAERLAVPADEVRKAIQQMLMDGRLWETALGTYRCILPPPPWMDAVRESLSCDGWPGLSWRYIAEDHCLEVFPTPFIREDDKDGAVCFMSHWQVDLDVLWRLFDGQTCVGFGATVQEGASFSIEGTISASDAWIVVLAQPPDIPPVLLLTTDGAFRKLTEEEQAAYEATHPDEGDDDDDDDDWPRFGGLWSPSNN